MLPSGAFCILNPTQPSHQLLIYALYHHGTYTHRRENETSRNYYPVNHFARRLQTGNSNHTTHPHSPTHAHRRLPGRNAP